MTEVDVVIIGGGISGLATAHALRSAGHGVLVLERQVRTGGNAISERIGGFLMEHGPSTVNLGMAGVAALAEGLGLQELRVDLGPGVQKRYLTKQGRLVGLGLHPLAFLMSGYLSLRGRARMMAETLVPRGDPDRDETVAEFGRRRFGAEFAERVLDPLVAGMFAGDATQTVLRYVLPALAGMERDHGSIVRAAFKARISGGVMPARRLSAWRDGVGTLPAAVAQALAGSVIPGCAVRRIARDRFGFDIDAGNRGRIRAKAVVLATQPHVATQLLETTAPDAAAACAHFSAPPLAVVFLGYRRRQVAHPMDGLGYLNPGSEARPANGALFCSTMFPFRAAQGHVAISAYVGGARGADCAARPPRELVGLVREELADLIGARGEPVLARVRQWPRGLPQYRPGHSDLLDRMSGALDDLPGLFVTGNYLRGVAVGACIDCARETAGRVSAHLGRAAETEIRFGTMRAAAVTTANPPYR